MVHSDESCGARALDSLGPPAAAERAPTGATGALAWLAYPGVMGLAIALACALPVAGLAPLLAGYCAALFGASAVAWLERRVPYREAWSPTREQLRVDALYLLAVQAALPLLFGATLTAAARAAALGLGLAPARLWPHAWPIFAQLALVIGIADLLRYGLHVACHRHPRLWRLHRVHHAPEGLYWLNVARFAPLEKALQFTLDALPFALLGVQAEVLGLYLAVYAVHGFFQHSNADLRFGWLNRLLSTPDLHRWHHSRVPEESSCNYGNNLIVWDWLFGTRFAPRDREVAQLGVDAGPPTDAGRAPFALRDRLERAALRTLGWVLRVRLGWLNAFAWPRLRRAARHPERAQRALLAELLRENCDTVFGREHGFADLRGVRAYRERVPVQDYESLRAHVQRQERDGSPELTREQPLCYARTSGTTGEPKDIPILRSSLRAHRRAQRLSMARMLRIAPRALEGRILAIASPAVEGWLPGGSPVGSASGHVYQSLPRVVRRKHVVPHEVFEIADSDLEFLTLARLALGARDITYAATANPSTLLRLLDVLRANRVALLEDAESGTFHRCEALSPRLRAAIRSRLRVGPRRLGELRARLARDDFALGDLWPELQLVSTWTGGSCGIALDALRRTLPATTRIAELGYLASELFGTLMADAERGLCLPALEDCFFEFAEKHEWERGVRELRGLEELEVGREYYVVITTRTGLYRYWMNDIVRVSGQFQACPTLQFVQKGRGVTSITGEKLYEAQVIAAVGRWTPALVGGSRFFVMLADVHAARYRLLLEPERAADHAVCALARQIDAELGRLNLEYERKRADGRLAPLQLCLLRPGTGDAYRRHCVERGQRESQFKLQPLQPAESFDYDYGNATVARS